MPFLTPLVVQEADEAHWEIREALVYEGSRETFTVEPGFITDLASVPRIFWNIFPPFGKHSKAAVLHDWLYRWQIVSRKDADGIFLRVMRELGVSWWRRKIMYRAVRIGGRAAWLASSLRKKVI